LLAVEETTRWLAFAALKETYSDNPEALDQAAALLADNFKDAMKDGIPLRVFGRDICLRLVPIGVKGDWPFLISVGHLERHFRRAPRKGESQLSGYGVCHICCGGLGGIPYEIFSSPPPWESSMQSAAAACPWESWSPFQDLPFIRTCRPWTFRPDIFHNFHLGHGKYFISSSMVVLQQFEEGGGVDARFQQLTDKWLAFCRSRKDARISWMFFQALFFWFSDMFCSIAAPQGKTVFAKDCPGYHGLQIFP